MSYQEQIFKEFASGRYGKKPYIEMSRKKTNMTRNIGKNKNEEHLGKNIEDEQTGLILENLINITKMNKERDDEMDKNLPIKKFLRDPNMKEINNNIQNLFKETSESIPETDDVPSEMDELINRNIQNILNESKYDKSEEMSHNEENDNLEKMATRQNNSNENTISTPTEILPEVQNKILALGEYIKYIEAYLMDMGKEMEKIKMVQSDIVNTLKNLENNKI